MNQSIILTSAMLKSFTMSNSFFSKGKRGMKLLRLENIYNKLSTARTMSMFWDESNCVKCSIELYK